MTANAPQSADSRHPPSLFPWLLDRLAVSVWSPSVHPGLYPSDVVYQTAMAYHASLPPSDQSYMETMPGRPPTRCLSWKRDHVRHIQLLGPRSYSRLVVFSAIRLTRHALEHVGLVTPFAPSASELAGNVMPAWALAGVEPEDLPGMLRSEAAEAILALPAEYESSLRNILGIPPVRDARVSLVGVELALDLPTPDPLNLIRGYVRPVSKNMMPRPRWGREGQIPPVYAVVGGAHPGRDGVHRLRFVAYPKLSASEGREGVARLEFRLRKPLIKRVLGSQVLPANPLGLHRAFDMLTEFIDPWIVAIESDRSPVPGHIGLADLVRAIGGPQNLDRVHSLLFAALHDGLVHVAPENRRHVRRLERSGWLCMPPFRRPAYRKITPGFDAAVRAVLAARFPAESKDISLPVSFGATESLRRRNVTD